MYHGLEVKIADLRVVEVQTGILTLANFKSGNYVQDEKHTQMFASLLVQLFIYLNCFVLGANEQPCQAGVLRDPN